MTIFILQPDPAHCRPFYVAQQLETTAWGHGATEAEARARMMEHRRNERLLYNAELEEVETATGGTPTVAPQADLQAETEEVKAE